MAHLEAYLNIFDKPLHIFYPKANEKKNKKSFLERERIPLIGITVFAIIQTESEREKNKILQTFK